MKHGYPIEWERPEKSSVRKWAWKRFKAEGTFKTSQIEMMLYLMYRCEEKSIAYTIHGLPGGGTFSLCYQISFYKGGMTT